MEKCLPKDIRAIALFNEILKAAIFSKYPNFLENLKVLNLNFGGEILQKFNQTLAKERFLMLRNSPAS